MRVQHIWLIGLGLLIGCGGGSDLERMVITGKVTYQGQPVADGLIRFVPSGATKGPPAGAAIKDGQYEVKAAGGVPAGTCRVEIKGFNPLPQSNKPPGGPDLVMMREAKEQYIPMKYNRESTLEVTISADGGQVHDFDLQ